MKPGENIHFNLPKVMFFQTQFEGHPSPSENRNIEPKSYAEMIQHPLF